MKKMFNTVYLWFPHRLWDKVVISLTAVVGYLSPIKNMAHLVLFFFFLDIVFGYWKDKKVNNAKFQPSLIWEKTVPRMVIVIILLLGSFMLDNTTGQEFVCTYKIVGWFFGALLLYSIGENGYKITGWRALFLFGRFARKKIKKETGIEITKEDLTQ